MATKRSENRLVELGVVGRPHGVHGEMRISIYNAGSEALDRDKTAFVGDGNGFASYEVDSVRPGSKCLLLKLEGVSDRETAAAMSGAKLFMRREDLPPLQPGEFYVDDLIGAEAWDGETLLGKITSSREQSGVEIVTVKGERDEIEVPLTEHFVESINLESGRLILVNSDSLPRDSSVHGEKK